MGMLTHGIVYTQPYRPFTAIRKRAGGFAAQTVSVKDWDARQSSCSHQTVHISRSRPWVRGEGPLFREPLGVAIGSRLFIPVPSAA